ncbi:hypothetical protein KSP40_PGU001048 [Platanthera guangdongensis]|uniref:DOG1 domain-containing protein n=1 Tax=Platanthera guangdongensis TaxID=2320717 RepID=A0ABR2M8G2_9ASPA
MSSPANTSSNSTGHRNPHDNFEKFFDSWLADQDRDLQSLTAAAALPPPRTADEEAAQNNSLRRLLNVVLSRYEHYYRAKEASALHDVRPMFNPSWTSTTENLFLWVGGWRPTMAIHLLYSKCGIQLESSINELALGGHTGNLADLDAAQLHHIDMLHRMVVRAEKEISEEVASAQEKVTDEPLVRLSHIVTEMGGGDGAELLEAEMKEKEEDMRKMLEKADCLRINTLKGLVEILQPMQALHFFIAAAELHLRIHDFGKMKDAEAKTPQVQAPAAI